MRKKFKRTCLGSSRGAYVRNSHFRMIQEELQKRGIVADLCDIITVTIKKRMAIKVFGKVILLTEEEAKKVDNKLIIYL